MRVIPTDLPGLVVIEPDVHRDARGYFLETFHAGKYAAHGIPSTFLQDNHSRSVRHTLSGLHLQVRKTAREARSSCRRRDLGRRSGRAAWIADIQTLGWSASVCRKLQAGVCPTGVRAWILRGEPLRPGRVKCTELYDPDDELGIAYDDATLAIAWPTTSPLLSEPRPSPSPTGRCHGSPTSIRTDDRQRGFHSARSCAGRLSTATRRNM